MTDTTARQPQGPPPAPPSHPEGEVVGFGWRLGLLLGGVAALGLFAGRGWLFIIGALFVMIFLHELGHFLTAKWSGMKVTEFFIFFGPKIWSFRRGETEYGIKCIPLGAYVRIVGMNNLDTDVAPQDEPRTYRQQSFPKRLLVVSAGSLMHMLQAVFLFTLVFTVMGVPGDDPLAARLGGEPPDEASWRVASVTPDSAADDIGLEPGDDIVSIAGEPVVTFDDLGPLVGPNPGEEVEVVFVRDGEEIEAVATLGRRSDDPDRGFLGVSPELAAPPAVRVNPARGAYEAVLATGDTIRQTVTGLAAFFTGGVDDFAGDVADGGSQPTVPSTGGGGEPSTSGDDGGNQTRPLSIYGIADIGADIFDDSLATGLLLMALVNVSIGVLNMIPLLPLDGGHVAIAVYERIRSIGGRRYMADVSRLLPLTYAVVMFLVLLGVSSIYLDIVDPIG